VACASTLRVDRRARQCASQSETSSTFEYPKPETGRSIAAAKGDDELDFPVRFEP